MPAKKTGGGAGLFHSSKLPQGGFTLVELVVATVVIGMMIIALSNLAIAIDAVQRQNQRITKAGRIAELKIESLRNQHYNALSDGTIDFTSELPSDLPSPHSAQVIVTSPTEDIKRLDVTVTYKDGKNTRNVKLSALIGNIGIAQ